MIIFIAFRVFTFDCSTTFVLLAGETLTFESTIVYIFNSFDANNSILLLKIALWHPNRANIMHPNIVANRSIRWICWLYKIVVVALLLSLTFFSDNFNNGLANRLLLSLYFLFRHIFFLLLVVRTLLRVFIISRINLFKNVCIDVNGCSFHCSSFYIAKRTGQVDTSRTKS